MGGNKTISEFSTDHSYPLVQGYLRSFWSGMVWGRRLSTFSFNFQKKKKKRQMTNDKCSSLGPVQANPHHPSERPDLRVKFLWKRAAPSFLSHTLHNRSPSTITYILVPAYRAKCDRAHFRGTYRCFVKNREVSFSPVEEIFLICIPIAVKMRFVVTEEISSRVICICWHRFRLGVVRWAQFLGHHYFQLI